MTSSLISGLHVSFFVGLFICIVPSICSRFVMGRHAILSRCVTTYRLLHWFILFSIMVSWYLQERMRGFIDPLRRGNKKMLIPSASFEGFISVYSS